MKKDKSIAVKVDALPVHDDPQLRKKQIEDVTNGIKDLGDGMKSIGIFTNETKKPTKIVLWLSVAIYGILLLMMGAAIAGVVMTTGIGGFFDNSELNKYFICSNGNYADKMKTYSDAKIFIEQFNGSCEIKHYKVIDYDAKG